MHQPTTKPQVTAVLPHPGCWAQRRGRPDLRKTATRKRCLQRTKLDTSVFDTVSTMPVSPATRNEALGTYCFGPRCERSVVDRCFGHGACIPGDPTEKSCPRTCFSASSALFRRVIVSLWSPPCVCVLIAKALSKSGSASSCLPCGRLRCGVATFNPPRKPPM